MRAAKFLTLVSLAWRIFGELKKRTASLRLAAGRTVGSRLQEVRQWALSFASANFRDAGNEARLSR